MCALRVSTSVPFIYRVFYFHTELGVTWDLPKLEFPPEIDTFTRLRDSLLLFIIKREWESGGGCRVEGDAEWRGVQSGGGCRVEGGAEWRGVQSGGGCRVEGDSEWRGVQSGGDAEWRGCRVEGM